MYELKGAACLLPIMWMLILFDVLDLKRPPWPRRKRVNLVAACLVTAYEGYLLFHEN